MTQCGCDKESAGCCDALCGAKDEGKGALGTWGWSSSNSEERVSQARDRQYTQRPKGRRAALEEMEEFRLAGDRGGWMWNRGRYKEKESATEARGFWFAFSSVTGMLRGSVRGARLDAGHPDRMLLQGCRWGPQGQGTELPPMVFVTGEAASSRPLRLGTYGNNISLPHKGSRRRDGRRGVRRRFWLQWLTGKGYRDSTSSPFWKLVSGIQTLSLAVQDRWRI